MDRFPRLGIDHGHHRIDQRARREILARTRLDLLCIAFEQALIDRAFDIDAEPEPSLAVDKADKTPQLGRVLDLVLRFEKSRSDDAGAARKLFENRRITPRQLLALQVAQDRPAAILGDRRRLTLDQARSDQPRPLLIHLEEQEIRDLRDVGLVRHALIPQHMGVVPDLLDEREFRSSVTVSRNSGRAGTRYAGVITQRRPRVEPKKRPSAGCRISPMSIGRCSGSTA